jgi:HAD superfamily hydrolase (TIGR01509 family)
MIRALIFDFDGLILDTEGPIYQSWQEIYLQYGTILTLETWAGNIGTYEEPVDPFEVLQEQVGRQLDRAEVLTLQRRRENELLAAQTVGPGVETYLGEARQMGLKIGLASSSTSRWVVGHLTRLGLLEEFDCIRVKEDVKLTKPDPALYLAAAQGLGVLTREAIALEDSPNGLLAAKRAGLFAVAVPNDVTRRLPLGHADWRVESLADLPVRELVAIAERALAGKSD